MTLWGAYPQKKNAEEEPEKPAELTLEGSMRDPVNWRAEELFRAGFTPEQSMTLANDRDVDLHKAVDLAKSAGPQLAFQILG